MENISEEEEDWEHEYPEGSLGWKINRRLAAIDAKPLKYGKIFLVVFAALLVPVIIEFLFQPFLNWLATFGAYDLAQYYTVVYAVTLLMFAGGFLYFGMRLIFSKNR